MWHTIPALVFVLLALMFFYALETPPPSEVTPPPIATAAALEGAPLVPGTPLLPLAMIADKPVLVNFFASWCTPCLGEHPLMKALAARGDVVLYGIGWNDTTENITAFLEKNGNPYGHVILDTDGRTAIAYGITGVPETFLIVHGRDIVYHQRGPLTEEIVKKEILPRLENIHE